MAFSAYLLVSNVVFWLRADSAAGTVVAQQEMEDVGGANIHRDEAYAPVIRFQTADGETVSIVSDVGYGENFAYRHGDEVTMLYLPADPQAARIRSFFELIGLPFVLAGFAAVFWVVGLFAQFMFEANSNPEAGRDRKSL